MRLVLLRNVSPPEHTKNPSNRWGFYTLKHLYPEQNILSYINFFIGLFTNVLVENSHDNKNFIALFIGLFTTTSCDIFFILSYIYGFVKLSSPKTSKKGGPSLNFHVLKTPYFSHFHSFPFFVNRSTDFFTFFTTFLTEFP